MFAMLGVIPFELLTSPVAMDGRRTFNYAEHAVIEGKPRLQYVGDGLEEYNFTFRFHREFCSPMVQYAALVASASVHVALPLILGNGLYLGRYVILEIADVLEAAGTDGTPVYLEVRVMLREWVEDDPVEIKKAEKKAKAPARVKNRAKNKKLTKTKKVNLPQLDSASRAAGYRVVSGSKIVRGA